MLVPKGIILVLAVSTALQSASALEDLIAEESDSEARVRSKTENRYDDESKLSQSLETSEDDGFGRKMSPKSTLDFRINVESLKASAAGNGKGKEDDDDEKTLAQQVADGKYGLIQNEIFPNGSKRPGIISYLPNPEVPKDTKDDFGGLDKDEIWLAEDHVLVLKGGAFPQSYNNSDPWPPIDNFIAPPRQVSIPKNPKIPPPFPIQLTENGPLEFVRGENGSLPPRPPLYPPFPFAPPPNANKTFPFPVPPGPLPPFLANLPPGTAFLPPPGNLSELDEDDPSIYYPPRYDFNYPVDNTTQVPPGPLVPGIILPPPPNFFAPQKPDSPSDDENETDNGDSRPTKPAYIAPVYLPSERKPQKQRMHIKRPSSKKKTTVAYVYPESAVEKTTKSPGFTSPIVVPNTEIRPVYRKVQTTTPKPYHISIPENNTLLHDIYIITTEPPESFHGLSELEIDKKPVKVTTFESISPEHHPLQSLIQPNVSVNYVGKVGHLPPITPTAEPRPVLSTPSGGHYITGPPTLTVTPVPIVKKIKVRPSTQIPPATFYFYEEPNPTQPTREEENEVSISPIDQFLRDNFKPSQLQDFEVKNIQSPVYIPAKTKTRTKTKSTYTALEEPPKLNALEIEYSGINGLQQSYKSTTEPTYVKPHKTHVTTQKPSTYLASTTDGPFIPSNYYATANPGNIHFTPLDPSMLDDITMKYFTIFGQRINGANSAVSTTPITPVTSTTTRYQAPTYTTPSTYFPITTPSPPPNTPEPVIKTTTFRPRPQSQFDQYLKEITGEDQKDYIITQNIGVPPKLKKAKAHPGFSNNYLNPYYIPYSQSEISQYIEGLYRPSQSTTLRPVQEVDIQSHYSPQISSTVQPSSYYTSQTQRPKPSSHNFGQYLQEVTYTGSQNPSHKSNLQYYDASSHSSISHQFVSHNQKPISLASDILVNYRSPGPINPDAELIHHNYDPNSNIRVVQPPDLSNTHNRHPYSHQSYQQSPIKQRPQVYESPTKTFFENIPNTGYFAQAQPNMANAFVSYNLPGNGGHFYFLTPQALDRSDSEDEGSHYTAMRRSDERISRLGRESKEVGNAISKEQRTHSVDSTNRDYLRRRRKKP